MFYLCKRMLLIRLINLNGSWLIKHSFMKELSIQKRDRKSAKHTIVKGDTLYSIANNYGTRAIYNLKSKVSKV